MTRLLNESFIPILLVISSIFLVIFYSNYVADLDADQVTVIEIPSAAIQQGADQELIVEEELFTQVEKLRVDDPVYSDAYQLIRNKQWQKAEKSYLELINLYDTSQARTELGYIYFKLDDYENAADQLVKALNKKTVYLPAYYYRAKNWGKMKSYEAAALDYLTYIKYFPGDFSAHFNLAMIRLKQQQYERAIASFKTASELAPGRKKSKALYFLGKSYQSLGPDSYLDAAQAYQQSIRIFPGNIKPRIGLASLLPDTEQGREEAENIYQQVLLLKPNYSQAHFLLAGIHSRQGNQREAIVAYAKAIEFNPSHIAARFNLGLILLDKKKWSEAADQFQAIMNINPQHARACFNLGRANYRLKNYDQALKNYKTALSLKNGDYPEVAINLGLIYSAKKDYETAIEVYKEALKKHNNSIPSCICTGLV